MTDGAIIAPAKGSRAICPTQALEIMRRKHWIFKGYRLVR